MSEREVPYLSAVLELTESVVPEVKKLHVTPLFDQATIEISLDEEGEEFIQLNRRQIECLVDFLSGWLSRLNPSAPTGTEANIDPGPAP